LRRGAHLENFEYVKFYVLDAASDDPKVYFMNTNTHGTHGSFARSIKIGIGGDGVPGGRRGSIVYHPFLTAPGGEAGFYRFEFEPNDDYSFEAVESAHEIIARNMPFLENNFAYYPIPDTALLRYRREKDLFDASRVPVLLEEDIFADISFLPLNPEEGYGFLRLMGIHERPNSRDIVLYEGLPNEMPRVGGIITTVPQTPLSHVNLRAIQDGVPNAYIAGAADDIEIAALIGKYVYFKVETDGGYQIREASSEEVDAFYVDRRPTEAQVPKRDLTATEARRLSKIEFDDSDAFGVKTANLATLRTLGFDEGVVPDGFGLPFYFYDEFMKHNGFYGNVTRMLADPEFQTDSEKREKALEDLRTEIEKGKVPTWMLNALSELQIGFPEGTSIRCRSSTNNEDLPGFSGAGLYDSFTHRPDERHLSKSIKQVYASMWNFRAFEEREFFRIDHLAAAMGVLLHPNFSDEEANGVAVSFDPFYQTEGHFYLNTQVGENLITNPDAQSIPEEILLDKVRDGPFTIVRLSNQVEDGEQVLTIAHMESLRTMLQKVTSRFRNLYGKSVRDEFAIDVEFKITSEGLLSIKQARPWIF
jgi:hypothetical protein